jgi:hypothetical protein
VRGYSNPAALEIIRFSKSSCSNSFMHHVLHVLRQEPEIPVE